MALTREQAVETIGQFLSDSDAVTDAFQDEINQEPLWGDNPIPAADRELLTDVFLNGKITFTPRPEDK